MSIFSMQIFTDKGFWFKYCKYRNFHNGMRMKSEFSLYFYLNPISQAALINGSFKLVYGSQHGIGIFTGPNYPNGTDDGSGSDIG